MKMDDFDVWFWEELKKKKNPMFTIGEMCRRFHNEQMWGGTTFDSMYSKVQRTMSKFEKFGLLHVYRVTNGGTVFMSKERAI